MSLQSAAYGPARPIGAATPAVRHIALHDLGEVLRQGWRDFQAAPTHLVFLCLIYPVVGLLLGRIASGENAIPLLYPLLAGFALIGPFAAVGIYDLSRQREQGETISWRNAFDVLRSPRIAPILLLGAMLAALFVVWLLVAQRIFDALMQPESARTIPALLTAAFTTHAGWSLVLIGTAVGFVFAVVAITLTIVSFPLLVDREVGPTIGDQAAVAVATSVRAVAANPVVIAVWGIIVAVGLALGMVTLFVGLAVVMPVLGHATWHLYRKLVA
ncbi:MAG: DUF2189 domain-containing protein [Acetobacteraceae bacterium]|nr:DUF2189 domain-containing protein [Acetobacteraceae bacterium]